MRIVNGFTYVDGKLSTGVELSMRGDTIAALGAHLPAEESFDASGCYVLPGFIDLHIHGFAGRDAMEGEDAVRHMAANLPLHGTTSFLPTTMTASIEETREAVAGVKKAMISPSAGAAVLGCHMEGPFFCAKKKGAQPEAHLMMPSMEAFESMVADHADAVRIISLAPELPGANEFIRAISEKGIVVSCGHSEATYEQVLTAVANGASEITHLFNAMSAFTHREPGMPGAALACPQLNVQFIADLIHLHPAVLRIMYEAKGADRCIAITDSMMAGGMPDGQYSLGGQDVYVKDGAARLIDGVLAGSVLTLRRSLQNMVQTVGIPLEEALPMYTTTPARRIGQARRGRLQAGCFADVVVLDSAFEVKAVWVGGKRLK